MRFATRQRISHRRESHMANRESCASASARNRFCPSGPLLAGGLDKRFAIRDSRLSGTARHSAAAP